MTKARKHMSAIWNIEEQKMKHTISEIQFVFKNKKKILVHLYVSILLIFFSVKLGIKVVGIIIIYWPFNISTK